MLSNRSSKQRSEARSTLRQKRLKRFGNDTRVKNLQENFLNPILTKFIYNTPMPSMTTHAKKKFEISQEVLDF